MTLFKNILSEMRLLKEDASVVDINDAISNMHPAEITYHNEFKNKMATGKRIIFPVAYGISTAGNPVIRAFEKTGDTATKVPAWKLFLLSNIDSWDTLSSETFKGQPLEGLANDGKDKQIKTLYNISPLSKTAKSWRDNEPEITSMPISKNDINMSGRFNAKDMIDATINMSNKLKNIDNPEEKEYNMMNSQSKRLNAEPETKPITKNEIPVDSLNKIEPEEENNAEKNLTTFANNDPITKDELNGENNKEKNPSITDTYKDMFNRWDKDKEENEDGNI